MSYADDEFLAKDAWTEYCAYAGIGYSTMFAPLRLQLALNERSNVNVMLSLGFDTDIFEFSRK
jgi:hypothetical protein